MVFGGFYLFFFTEKILKMLLKQKDQVRPGWGCSERRPHCEHGAETPKSPSSPLGTQNKTFACQNQLG